MDVIMSVNDLAMEVLFRLSVKDLALGKCVSKRWYSVISSPEFLRLHLSRSKESLMFYCQDVRQVEIPITDFPMDLKDRIDPSLNFLPEKVIIMASCNGLLCCRSWVSRFDNPNLQGFRQSVDGLACNHRKKRSRSGSQLKCSKGSCSSIPRLYVCNPQSKEYVILPGPKCFDATTLIALSFSLSSSGSGFNLVSVRRLRTNPKIYTFMLYSAKTGRWRTCKEVCESDQTICPRKQLCVGSKCHWLMPGHCMMTFDIEKECPKVIKLPGPVVEIKHSGLGSSEGHFNYCCVAEDKLCVWMLNEYETVEWVLIRNIGLFDVFKQRKFLDKVSSTIVNNQYLFPLGLYGQDLFFWTFRSFFSINLRTQKVARRCLAIILDGFFLGPILLPYMTCLASVGVLK